MPPKKAVARWEFQGDDGNFVACAAAASRAIEAAHAACGGTGVVMLTLNGGKYDYDFDKWTQTNKESGKSRNLRRIAPPGEAVAPAAAAPVAAAAAAPEVPVVVAAPAPPPAAPPAPVVWSWLDDKGVWKPYAADKIDELEKGYQQTAKLGGTTLSMALGDWTYTMDFVKGQQINDSTKRARNIQRTGGAPETCQAAVILANASVGTKKSRSDDDTNTAPLKKSAAEAADAAAAPKSAVAADASKSAGKSMAGGGTKLIKKGRGVVDPASGMAPTTHIYDDGKIVWQAMLNQTNVGQNNNKFYVIQLLEADAGSKYWVFTRWGRVGAAGQSALDTAYSVDGAKAQFESKFRDKTKNSWTHVCNNAENFTKHAGKYQLMDIVHGAEGDDGDDDVDHVTNSSAVGSALPPQLQRLMRMIGSKGDMTKAMKELEIDTAKLPLGKISKKQIKDAFAHLKNIESELKKPKPNQTELMDSSSMFFTLIPHDFGFSLPPTIRDMEHLKRKMDLLEMLADLEVASKLLSEGKKVGKHPLDSSYEALKCDLKPLDHSSPEFLRIQRMVENTHGATHHMKVRIEDVFEVSRAGETTRYQANYGSLHNKTMFWHGSRTTNFMGILSQGLRIAPPEAPCTGYMFGKGVYFADCVTKSANYCHSSTEGIMMLCETALGNTYDCTAAKYMDKPMPGTQSTFGIGRNVPDPAGDEFDADGVKYPCGKLVPGKTQHTSLLYNEFIVYDVSQLRMRYLLVCKFGKK